MRQRTRNPWVEDGWVDATVEVVVPDGDRELVWDLGVFDPTDPSILTEDEIEERLYQAVRGAMRDGFLHEGDDVILRMGDHEQRFKIVSVRGQRGLQGPREDDQPPHTPRWRGPETKPVPAARRNRQLSVLDGDRAIVPLNKAREYRKHASDIRKVLLEEVRPLLGSHEACEEILGLVPAGTYLEYQIREAKEACKDVEARPTRPGAGRLDQTTADSIYDQGLRYEQLIKLAQNQEKAAWTILAPGLTTAEECAKALEFVQTGPVAVQIRNRMLEL